MNWYKLCAKPKEVPLYGKLQANGDYIYLDIDTRIIVPFINMIDSDDVLHPKSVTERSKDVGAHISVMKGHEVDGRKIKELGDEFEFFVTGVHSTKPDGWEEVKKVYFITVSSPELEGLRRKYKLPAKIDGHEFHITVGVEKQKGHH
jgi:hypothetical protein